MAEIAKRKANGEDVEAPKKKVKRMKEVYMLIKPRYYAEVSEKDLTADVDLSEDTEEIHMILQHKVR